MTDVVIVGGGIGGLVAARALVLGGVEVTVLEASDRLGGSVSSQTVGGIRLDAGAESFATRGGTVAAYLARLGLGDDIVEPNPAGAWLHTADGRSLPLPALSLLGIPGSPLARDVVAVLGSRAGFRAFSEALLPGTYGAKAETLGQLVRLRMGDAVVDRLVAPIVRGVHSGEPDALPLDRVAPGLRASLLRTGSLARAVQELRAGPAKAGSAVAGVRGGVFRLVEALAAELERFGVDVRLGARVTAVDADGVQLGEERITGRVVVAAPGLLGDRGCPGRATTLATLVVDQPLLDAAPRGTGVLVTDGAPGIRARALTHSTAKWRWLASEADGRHVVRLSYAEEDGKDGGDLAELARADASTLLGVPLEPGRVLDFGAVTWFRPPVDQPGDDAIPVVGETAAGTGLASVIAHAESTAATLLDDFAA